MSKERDRPDDAAAPARDSAGLGAGYADRQLERALAAAARHTDPELRERARQRAERWREVVSALGSGRIALGSRTPLARTPAWATLDVLHGGFASGELRAGGPLRPHERALAGELGISAKANAGVVRAALNRWYLGEDGQARLLAWLADGRYRIEVAEEGALATVAALRALGHDEEAAALARAIAPWFARLRFYPLPADLALPEPERMHVRTAGQGAASLRAVGEQAQVLAQKEAVEVWAPFHDRVVALFLETVEDDWPCRRYGPGWSERAQALLQEYAALRARHPRCAGPERRNRHPAQLREFLGRCAARPQSLDRREVGRIRLILQRHCAARGVPGSAEAEAHRARQRRDVAGPSLRAFAQRIAPRLEAAPADRGLASLEPALAPLDAREAASLGLAEGTPLPAALRRRIEPCLEAALDELVERGLVGSGEEVARLLPAASAQAQAAGLADAALRRLYVAIYRAFRTRRSLLLLNLQSQVRLSELPWIAALDRLRTGPAAATARADVGAAEAIGASAPADVRDSAAPARALLARTAALALANFPQAPLPNPLVVEFDALAREAGLRLALTPELAADIFTGELAPVFLRAAREAALAMQGSAYARYYDIDAAQVLALPEDRQSLAALCAQRAGVAEAGNRAARNGQLLEQLQILTTHNLSALCQGLDLHEALAPRLEAMAQRCLEGSLARLRMKTEGRHARLIRLKHCANAWRQMLFFLSLLPKGAQRGFAARAEAALAVQPASLQARWAPFGRGLAMALRGQRLDRPALRATGAQRLLGWTAGPHPLLE